MGDNPVGAGGGSKGGEGEKHVRNESGPPRADRPQDPGRGKSKQTLRSHNKDEHDDSPFGAGITERGRACPVRGGGKV